MIKISIYNEILFSDKNAQVLKTKVMENELPEQQAKRDTLKIALASQEEVLSGSKDLVERWDTLPYPERRQVVETILERVVIGDGEVEFNFLYNPGFANAAHSQSQR